MAPNPILLIFLLTKIPKYRPCELLSHYECRRHYVYAYDYENLFVKYCHVNE
jgi:hypothetical protein